MKRSKRMKGTIFLRHLDDGEKSPSGTLVFVHSLLPWAHWRWHNLTPKAEQLAFKKKLIASVLKQAKLRKADVSQVIDFKQIIVHAESLTPVLGLKRLRK